MLRYGPINRSVRSSQSVLLMCSTRQQCSTTSHSMGRWRRGFWGKMRQHIEITCSMKRISEIEIDRKKGTATADALLSSVQLLLNCLQCREYSLRSHRQMCNTHICCIIDGICNGSGHRNDGGLTHTFRTKGTKS